MFDSLSDRIGGFLRKMQGTGKISESNIKEVLREIRLILLEADVNFKVAKSFIARVKDKALGADVLRGVSPAQQMTKIIHDELTTLLGGATTGLAIGGGNPDVIMFAGVQGSGKTTAICKLARMQQAKGGRPLLVAADLSRPAAIDQLEINAREVAVPVYAERDTTDVAALCDRALQHARTEGITALLIDTAGRMHADTDLMQELQRIVKVVNPAEILLVIDGMSGQDALTVAKEFSAGIPVSGFIMTKLDGDSRGGAALSIREVTGHPIKYISSGEGFDRFEQFHPDRIASRILGKGDIVSLVEKAQDTIDADTAKDLEKKLQTNRFTLADFLTQLRQIKKMGPLGNLLEMMPGGKALKGMQGVDDSALERTEAIICSMTPGERDNPGSIDGSRRRRIAAGCGMQVQDVNQLLKQFKQIEKMMKMFGKGARKRGGLPLPF